MSQPTHRHWWPGAGSSEGGLDRLGALGGEEMLSEGMDCAASEGDGAVGEAVGECGDLLIGGRGRGRKGFGCWRSRKSKG